MSVVHRAFLARNVAERALVLRAMHIEHEVQRGVLGWVILVPEHEADLAIEQWRLYEEENRKPPRPDPSLVARPGVAVGVIAWILILVLFGWLQDNASFGIDWLSAGRLDVGAVRGGDLWRVLTALTLHADAAHVIGNLILGGVFGGLLAREVGGGLAWLVILIGGGTGNLMNSAVQPPDHLSIGASTAVFAAIGALSAYLWTGNRKIRDTWARRIAPIVAGIVLLAWFGTGDERTDIVAHLTGFIAGFLLGIVLGRIPRQATLDVRRQQSLGAATVAALLVAWASALLRG